MCIVTDALDQVSDPALAQRLMDRSSEIAAAHFDTQGVRCSARSIRKHQSGTCVCNTQADSLHSLTEPGERSPEPAHEQAGESFATSTPEVPNEGVLSADGWRVKSAWQAANGDWRYSYAADNAVTPSDDWALDDAFTEAMAAPLAMPDTLPSGELAYVVGAGDLQLGKSDGDGSAGTIARFYRATDAAVVRLEELRTIGRPIGTVVLPWLGDCIEGVFSQGGKLVMRLDLTPTQQVRAYRRLMLHQVRRFAPLAERVIVPVVPGNHDEAFRMGDKMATTYDDSWAVEGASAVQDAIDLDPSTYGHVEFLFPRHDELTITHDVLGVRVGYAHGHQWGSPDKVRAWWRDQSFGRNSVGDADVLFSAHSHHFRSEMMGDGRAWVQIPAFDGGSQWFKHRRGDRVPAGSLTTVIGDDHDPFRDMSVVTI